MPWRLPGQIRWAIVGELPAVSYEMRQYVGVLALRAAAAAASPVFLQTDDSETPLEKAPAVDQQFKVTPVSTSLKCVISLTILYFVIYTAIALGRTIGDVMKAAYGHFESIMKSAMCSATTMEPWG